MNNKKIDGKSFDVKETYIKMVKELENMNFKELILLQQAIIQSMLRFI